MENELSTCFSDKDAEAQSSRRKIPKSKYLRFVKGTIFS